MKKLVLDSVGVPPTFKFMDIDIPKISDDEILIKVKAVGLCYHDLLISEGVLRRGVKDELVLGHEFSGEVVEIGESISDLEINDKVVCTLTSSCGNCILCATGQEYNCQNAEGFGHGRDGGLSEYIALKRNNIVRLPNSFDIIGSSLIACPMAVSLKALKDVSSVEKGEDVVIFGAGGGLGIHAAQIANALGANVIAFTSSSEKFEKLNEFVEQIFLLEDYLEPSEIVFSLTENKGADVVFNPIGASFFENSLNCISNKGRMILLGQIDSSLASINVAEILFREISILGSVGANVSHINSVINMISKKVINPVVDIVPVQNMPDAITLLRSNSVAGRIVLTF